jgi:hypothetical protein
VVTVNHGEVAHGVIIQYQLSRFAPCFRDDSLWLKDKADRRWKNSGRETKGGQNPKERKELAHYYEGQVR